jgi:hypothetical protein
LSGRGGCTHAVIVLEMSARPLKLAFDLRRDPALLAGALRPEKSALRRSKICQSKWAPPQVGFGPRKLGRLAQQPVPLVLVRHAFTDVNWVLTPLPMA